MQFAHRMAALLGCTLGELPGRIGWDEWIEWRAWWEVEPWGELRADLRQSVALAYQLAPYLPAGRPLPGLCWPYFDEAAEVSDEEMQAAAAAERQRWADWEAERQRQRRENRVDG